ncbi:hypothetical protein [Jeongeupia chitinilytica]|uniref:Uncharacterized protein n=1 Tax=Jeongeupia chitinilytica TaxID=1041641 RepID=A0ABQ3GX49_9NEIS|nr:hypothetical protein [Jeongeupia chitinilytica]GHD59433.1 hypothetical protein GCM10007350_10900 [Jeongeupia chitinilytica]
MIHAQAHVHAERKPVPVVTLLKFNAPLIACVVMLLAYALGAFG